MLSVKQKKPPPARGICKLGDLAYFGKFTKFGEKKRLFRQKKNTRSMIAGPGPTSAGSFEVVLLSKNESIYEKSEPHNLKINYFLGDFT